MSATLIDVRRGGVPQTPQPSRKGPPRLHGRILVADDSDESRRTFSSMLVSMGLKVALAETGRAAFQMALAGWQDGRMFDLVLMDTEMPEIDGYEATALLRAVGYHGRIIAVAPCAFNRIHDKSVAAGCDGYATKPISCRTLRATIQRYLTGKTRAAP
jgi:CheY-like chemotaxis protein